MKYSIFTALFVLLLIGLGLGWFSEFYRARQLQAEIDLLKTKAQPDYFAHAYHPNTDLSMFVKDPLAEADSETSKLYRALVTQPEAWNNGLIQYLGVDRIRDDFEPKITMTVWWHGEVLDAQGNEFLLYLADRKCETKSPPKLHSSFSAYIVTDAQHKLVHWSGCDIDRLLVSEIESSGGAFPAGLKYREESRHNGDSSIEVRMLTKSGISK